MRELHRTIRSIMELQGDPRGFGGDPNKNYSAKVREALESCEYVERVISVDEGTRLSLGFGVGFVVEGTHGLMSKEIRQKLGGIQGFLSLETNVVDEDGLGGRVYFK